jgi:hypothetical protein
MTRRGSTNSQTLTVGALVHHGPLVDARALIDEHFDRTVPRVALVSELEQIRTCAPHTAVVLHQAVAHGAWAVESAMRLAWERAASCLVTPSAPGVGESTATLARRLRMPLFVVEEDSARCALDLAAAIARPEAVRAELTSRCAVLFGERPSTRGILGVLNSEVPGVTVALVSGGGHVLAGRDAGRTAGRGHREVREDVPGPEGRPWATLVASVSAEAEPSPETVRTILRLARVPLAASVARTRLDAVHDSARASATLDALLAAQPPTPEPDLGETPDVPTGVAENWRIEGRHVAVFVRPSGSAEPDVSGATPGVVSAWQQVFGDRPLVPRAAGWASWWSGEEVTPTRVARELRRGMARMQPPFALRAGAGESGTGTRGLRDSLVQAELASAAASAPAGERVELFADLGPRALLACLPLPELATAARVAMADLLSADDHDTLVDTMRALLDCGGSTGQAAAQLGVHRNTVLGRMERIRAHGVDLGDPRHRLGLHLASYALSRTRT